jgi:phage terminase large subunit-like protein
MAWVLGNAKVEPVGNHLMITKQISGRAKIDPLIALLEAAILMSWNPAGQVFRSGRSPPLEDGFREHGSRRASALHGAG